MSQQSQNRYRHEVNPYHVDLYQAGVIQTGNRCNHIHMHSQHIPMAWNVFNVVMC